jgi:DNA-binding transcriptional ArsR family regulator
MLRIAARAWFVYHRTMKDGPHIARIAALIGDRARAEILTALMAGEALTATELAAVADVTKQTISAHLAKLVDAKLLAVVSQGRHRYFRLADRDVAGLIESLMGVAQRAGALRLKTSPREPALRKARVCYDHLAGELGVYALDNLQKRGLVRRSGEGLELTHRGRAFCESIGVGARETGRRALCRPCLDWSVRRDHLAGTLGAALLDKCYGEGWAKRVPGTRVVQFTPAGERAFRECFS